MRKTILLFSSLFLFVFFAQSQDTMYFMKNGVVIDQYNVNTEVDSIIFYTPSANPVAVSSIVLTSNNISVNAGQTIDLSSYISSIQPVNATNKAVSWTSNNTSAVTITNASTGAAVAGASGTAIVTVTASDGSGISSQLTVTISEITANPGPFATGKIPNAVYIGRWNTSGAVDRGYWATSCVKVNVKGTTSVKIEYENNNTWEGEGLAYSINEGPLTFVYKNNLPGSGIVQVPLSNSLDSSKEYSITIYNGPGAQKELNDSRELPIRNLILDQGGITLAPTHVKPFVLEFIGDSITAGFGNLNVAYNNYSFLTGQLLGAEVVNIAQSGITFASMATKYFNTPSGYDFSQYHPDLIFINLGTNPAMPTQQDIVNYFTALRAKHPDAYIMMTSLFRSTNTDQLKTEIEGAIATLGDPKMLFTSGMGIISAPAGVDYLDFNHPNEQGNQKLAAHFAPIIANVLGISYP